MPLVYGDDRDEQRPAAPDTSPQALQETVEKLLKLGRAETEKGETAPSPREESVAGKGYGFATPAVLEPKRGVSPMAMRMHVAKGTNPIDDGSDEG